MPFDALQLYSLCFFVIWWKYRYLVENVKIRD